AASRRLFDLADADFRARLSAVRHALYLLFNEGYHGTSVESAVRVELCREAVRLVLLLLEHEPAATPETHALAALFFLHPPPPPAGGAARPPRCRGRAHSARRPGSGALGRGPPGGGLVAPRTLGRGSVAVRVPRRGRDRGHARRRPQPRRDRLAQDRVAL